MVLAILIFIIIFSNQYLLFNEELFIILAFLSLCYFVKQNLGGLVSNELQDRKNKILNSYLSFLSKKSQSLNSDNRNISSKLDYLNNYCLIQKEYFNKYTEMFNLLKIQSIIDFNKNVESNFIYYFAGLVSLKRKFL